LCAFRKTDDWAKNNSDREMKLKVWDFKKLVAEKRGAHISIVSVARTAAGLSADGDDGAVIGPSSHAAVNVDNDTAMDDPPASPPAPGKLMTSSH
jgi:hypothetical protein